ncbi:Glycosyl transferase, family 9 [alpha proteobacterium BAL199]|nr:Glycosyl transferase, family 9 [alpha proteobacterium BAL199]
MSGTLVIQPLPGIGDMVWHLPHLEAIARTSPDNSVTVLTKRRSRADELFDGSSFVRQVLWLERAQSGEPLCRHDGPLGSWRLAADLRAHAFDAVWILHDSARYALAARLARIPNRIGYGTGRQRWHLNDRRVLDRGARHRPTIEKATSLLGLHGIQIDPTPRYSPTPTAVERVAAAYGSLPRPWLGLGIGSSEPFKQWGAIRFAELTARLRQATGATVFAIGGPSERDIVETIRAVDGADVVSALGLPIGEAAALASACDVVVGNDTGLLNLSAATGVATVGLFGGSPPLTQYTNLATLQPTGGAIYRVDRMSEITTSAVEDAILPLLAKDRPHAAR